MHTKMKAIILQCICCGVDIELWSEFGETLLADLAGNAFATSVCSPVLIAVLAHGWTHTRQQAHGCVDTCLLVHKTPPNVVPCQV